MVSAMRQQLRWPALRFLSDPVRRGTWPALLWAMAHLRQGDPEAVVAVLTADHLISDADRFCNAVAQAVQVARQQPAIVMLGVRPSSDARGWLGFGCFRRGERLTGLPGAVIAGFEEKPSLARAEAMLGEGGWLWNSGMFFFRISTAEAALQAFQPSMERVYVAIREALVANQRARAARLYAEFPDMIPHPTDPRRRVDNTIDYAILTPLAARRSAHLFAVAASEALRGWKDLGQWDVLRDIVPLDRWGNVVLGRAEIDGSVRRCILVVERGCRLEARAVERHVVALTRRQALIADEAALPRLKALIAEVRAAPTRKIVAQDAEACRVRCGAGQVALIGVRGLDVDFASGRLRIQRRQGL
jgi:mannose-1-phosphate guanylyltransferase